MSPFATTAPAPDGGPGQGAEGGGRVGRRLRSLVLAYAHPGALWGWALVALTVVLDVLWVPDGPLPILVLVADVPFLWLLWAGSRGRWKRWIYLQGVVHVAVTNRWLLEVGPGQLIVPPLLMGVVILAAGGVLRALVARRVPYLLAVPTVLVFEEIGRGFFMGGFPWPSRSLAFTGSAPFTAAASLVGAHGLTFLAALSSAALAGLPALLWVPRGYRGRAAARVAGGVLLACVGAGVLYRAGHMRVDGYLTRRIQGGAGESRDLLVAVQGDVAQSLKHSAASSAPQAIFRRHLDLSRLALQEEGTRHVLAVLWPETMVPWPLPSPDLAVEWPDAWWNEVRVLQNVAREAVPVGDRPPPFLLGAIHVFRRGDERHPSLVAYGTHDSLFLVDPRHVPEVEADGLPPPPREDAPWALGRHDKVRLVPGGEYTPGGRWFPPLRWLRDSLSIIPPLDEGRSDQEPMALGTIRHGSRDLAIRVGTVICFELAFPARCRAWRRDGATVLLNPSNYGWFGPTAFRAQVRAMAALRAAETGTTVVMAGNTGPTAAFDPVGRPLGTFRSIDLGTGAVGPPGDPTSDANTFVTGYLATPLAVDTDLPPSTRWGDLPWYALGLLVLGIALRRGRRGRPGDGRAGPATDENL